jgi:poly(3-hydroxybutyrate) depolymerase
VKRRVKRLWRMAVGATGVLAVFATIAIVSTHNGNGSSDDLASAQGRPSATSSLASPDGQANVSPGCARPGAREPIARAEFSVDVGGSSRSALVQAPRALESLDARAVLIDIPESFQDVDRHFADSALVTFAAQRQLLLVTPIALPGLPWNPAEADGLGADLEYLDSLLTQIGQEYCVDLSEVHVVGFGTGAHLAAGFACDQPDIVRSLTMVSGIYRPSDCAGSARSITAIVNGADDVFPLSGGRGPGFDSLPGATQQTSDPGYEPVVGSFVAQQYREAAACEGGTRTENEAGVAWTYGICPGGTQISFGVVDGAGHVWTPAATEALRARLILSE